MPLSQNSDFIYRSLDSVYLGDEKFLDRKDMFPLVPLEFEGELYPAPKNYEELLMATYDYLSLPANLHPGHAGFSDVYKSQQKQIDSAFSQIKQK